MKKIKMSTKFLCMALVSAMLLSNTAVFADTNDVVYQNSFELDSPVDGLYFSQPTIKIYGDELVENGDFSINDLSKWAKTGFSFSRVNYANHSGTTTAACMFGTNSNVTNEARVPRYTMTGVTLQPGIYELSAWVKGKKKPESAPWPAVYIGYPYSNDAALGKCSALGTETSLVQLDDTTWKKINSIISVKEAITDYQIAVHFVTNNYSLYNATYDAFQFYIDDLSMKQVTNAKVMTATNREGLAVYDLEELRGETVNTKITVKNESGSNQNMSLITCLYDSNGTFQDVLAAKPASVTNGTSAEIVTDDYIVPADAEGKIVSYVWTDWSQIQPLRTDHTFGTSDYATTEAINNSAGQQYRHGVIPNQLITYLNGKSNIHSVAMRCVYNVGRTGLASFFMPTGDGDSNYDGAARLWFPVEKNHKYRVECWINTADSGFHMSLNSDSATNGQTVVVSTAADSEVTNVNGAVNQTDFRCQPTKNEWAKVAFEFTATKLTANNTTSEDWGDKTNTEYALIMQNRTAGTGYSKQRNVYIDDIKIIDLGVEE